MELRINPKAVKRVKNPLPAPEGCRYCGGPVELTSNAVIYGREYGDWPYVYACRPCDAYVGVHPQTDIPLGTLADAELRAARKTEKPHFERLWRGPGARFTRRKAYAWLAEQMGLEPNACHWAWFDQEQCRRAGELCRKALED